MKPFVLFLWLSAVTLSSQSQSAGAGQPLQNQPPDSKETLHRDNMEGKGRFFLAELKDGEIINGSGLVKIKEGTAVLTIQTDQGKTFTLKPDEVQLLSQITPAGKEFLINFENKYWLCKLRRNVAVFYQTVGESDLLFIKEDSTLRIATNVDVTGLVKNNKIAYKLAKRGKIKRALEAYIGEEAPASRTGSQAQTAPKRPLFNAQ